MTGPEGREVPRGESPQKVIDRITQAVESGRINPNKLISDADFLLVNAGKEGRELVRPFLQEAVRRAPAGVIERALIDRLVELDSKKVPGKRNVIRRFVQLGEDLGLEETEAGHTFIDALREKYQLNRYILHAWGEDIPVKVTVNLGIGSDGREYVRAEGYLQPIPKDELSEAEYVEESQGGPKGKDRWSGLFGRKQQQEASPLAPSEIDPKTEARVQNLVAQYRREYEARGAGIDLEIEEGLVARLRKELHVEGETSIDDSELIKANPGLYRHFVSFKSLLAIKDQTARERNIGMLKKLLGWRSEAVDNYLQRIGPFPDSIYITISDLSSALRQVPRETLTDSERWLLGSVNHFADMTYLAWVPSHRLMDSLKGKDPISAKEIKKFLAEFRDYSVQRRTALLEAMGITNEIFAQLAQENNMEITPGRRDGHPATLREKQVTAGDRLAEGTNIQNERLKRCLETGNSKAYEELVDELSRKYAQLNNLNFKTPWQEKEEEQEVKPESTTDFSPAEGHQPEGLTEPKPEKKPGGLLGWELDQPQVKPSEALGNPDDPWPSLDK